MEFFQLRYTTTTTKVLPEKWPIIKSSALSHIWGSTPDDAGERLNGIQEVSGSIPLISTKRGPDEPGNDLFRWSCVRSVPAAAEKAVKENRHPALWPGAFSCSWMVYPSGLSCCASGAGPFSASSGSIKSSMWHSRAWATL